MNYEIVTLEEKTVAGISARTNNGSPDMGAVTGTAFIVRGFMREFPKRQIRRLLEFIRIMPETRQEIIPLWLPARQKANPRENRMKSAGFRRGGMQNL